MWTAVLSRTIQIDGMAIPSDEFHLSRFVAHDQDRPMRLGIYGGTFDPVHYGHLLAAEQSRERCALDEVWFVPAAVPPHKRGESITPGRQRTEMLELAVAGMPQFRVSRMELERTGPSYTVDTLIELKRDDPSRELFLILGADSVSDFPTWYEPRRIAELATLVVVNRGLTPPELGCLSDLTGPHRPIVVSMPAVDLSATDIRERVRAGRSIRFMTPRAVEAYIQQHRLYA
jgi:nicotinate-nucleotide adenylyltransferase